MASRVYDAVCRTDFSRTGFMLLDLPMVADSFRLRRVMVDLKREVSEIHPRRTGKSLAYMSMGRFDQQVTTKPHRDGGPNQSLLMLGYEPTSVRGSILIADYAKWAAELGITPQQLLAEHNPMCASGEQMLIHLCLSPRTI